MPFLQETFPGKRVRLLPAGLGNWSGERGKVFGTVTKIYINMKKGEGRE